MFKNKLVWFLLTIIVLVGVYFLFFSKSQPAANAPGSVAADSGSISTNVKKVGSDRKSAISGTVANNGVGAAQVAAPAGAAASAGAQTAAQVDAIPRAISAANQLKSSSEGTNSVLSQINTDGIKNIKTGGLNIDELNKLAI